MSGVLIDTTVLIKAYQTGDRDPDAAKAKDAVEALARRGNGYIAVQNLDEVAALLVKHVAPASLRGALSDLEHVFGVLRPGARTLDSALHAVEKHRLGFWDSMIWAVARENGIDEVLTADPPKPPVIDGVRYRNPLA